MIRRIDHVEIVPADLERSIAFYTDVLGFRLRGRHPVSAPPMREVVYLTLGDTMLELIGADVGPAPDPERWEVGFRGMALEVPDMAEALRTLAQRGYPAAWGPADLGDSLRAEIRDPDGLILELREWKKKAG